MTVRIWTDAFLSGHIDSAIEFSDKADEAKDLRTFQGLSTAVQSMLLEEIGQCHERIKQLTARVEANEQYIAQVQEQASRWAGRARIAKTD